MSAGFFDPAPPGGKNLHGFDEDVEYQMVPVGGTRTVALQVFLNEPADVEIFIDPPSLASIKSFVPVMGKGHRKTARGLIMEKDSSVLLEIEGLTAGRGLILVVPVAGGAPTRTCKLAVKNKFTLTYQLGIVSDAIHVPDKAGVGRNLAANMRGAEAIWLAAANVELVRVGDILDVVVPANLGNPIVIDNLVVPMMIANASVSSKLVPANLYVYGTWDLVYSSNPNVAGSNTFNLCFIENASTGTFGALLCAHEIGHALGLTHLPTTQPEILMTQFGIINARLTAGQIEFCNRAR